MPPLEKITLLPPQHIQHVTHVVSIYPLSCEDMAMKHSPSYPANRPGLHFQLFDDATHPSYIKRKKMAEASTCADCGATYSRGSWKWGMSAQHTHSTICPACKRIYEKMPAKKNAQYLIKQKHTAEH